MLPEEDPPCKVSRIGNCNISIKNVVTGKNTIVVLEVKYILTSYAYSESVAQWIKLWGQDEHEVAVGVTQHTFSG